MTKTYILNSTLDTNDGHVRFCSGMQHVFPQLIKKLTISTKRIRRKGVFKVTIAHVPPARAAWIDTKLGRFQILNDTFYSISKDFGGLNVGDSVWVHVA